MLRSAIDVKGYGIQATDGAVGKVADFLFDDETWVVRYLVADTGKWLPGRLVLIAPQALGEADWRARRLAVAMTREQIERSPGIEQDRPVSRQQEEALHRHYGWSMYWAGPAGVGAWPAAMAQVDAERVPETTEGDRHLRSLREVTGYHITATDGSIGHAEDLILDDRQWWLTYLVVDTRNWIPGRKVLISPTWVRKFDWADRRILVDLDRETIRNSPEFDPSQPINRVFEEQLYDFYGRPAYWKESETPSNR